MQVFTPWKIQSHLKEESYGISLFVSSQHRASLCCSSTVARSCSYSQNLNIPQAGNTPANTTSTASISQSTKLLKLHKEIQQFTYL